MECRNGYRIPYSSILNDVLFLCFFHPYIPSFFGGKFLFLVIILNAVSFHTTNSLVFILLLGVCPVLPDPDNGTVTTSGNTVGDVAMYNCGPDYELVGDDMRTCLADGTWNGSVPICARK